MSQDSLSTTFAALADPTRRAILARLASGAASVTELAEPFAMSMPAISKHLKVLEKAGLIERSRDAQWRPCTLKAAPLKEAANWIVEYRRFWEESFNRLDNYLQQIQSQIETAPIDPANPAPKSAPDSGVENLERGNTNDAKNQPYSNQDRRD